MLKKKKVIADIGKIMKVNKDDVDRIAGGMIRLESKYAKSWSKYIKHSLKLAKSNDEKMLVWYFIGHKSGFMSAQGLIIIPKPNGMKEFDPSVQ